MDANMNFLSTPAGGVAKATRESIRGTYFFDKYLLKSIFIMTPVMIGPTTGGAESRPLPAGGRPKPTLQKVAERPKVRALYDSPVIFNLDHFEL